MNDDQLFDEFLEFVEGIKQNDRVYLVIAVQNFAKDNDIEIGYLENLLEEKKFFQDDYLNYREED